MFAAIETLESGPLRGWSLPRVCPSRDRPVDLVHLSIQAMGDRALEAEILDLLRTQIAAITASLIGADDARRAATAHAMAGTARNVGAFSLAAAASRLEGEPENAAHLASFEKEMARVALFLRSMQQPV